MHCHAQHATPSRYIQRGDKSNFILIGLAVAIVVMMALYYNYITGGSKFIEAVQAAVLPNMAKRTAASGVQVAAVDESKFDPFRWINAQGESARAPKEKDVEKERADREKEKALREQQAKENQDKAKAVAEAVRATASTPAQTTPTAAPTATAAAPVATAPAPEPVRPAAPTPRTEPTTPAPTATAPARPAADATPGEDARLVSREEPAFPREALRDGVNAGNVRARLNVSAEGVVTSVTILEANPRGYFERPTQRALQRWRYSPTSAPHTKVVELAFKTSDQ